MVVCQARDWLAVVGGLRFPMVGAGLESGCRMLGEMVVKRLWLSGGWKNAWRLGRVGG